MAAGGHDLSLLHLWGYAQQKSRFSKNVQIWSQALSTAPVHPLVLIKHIAMSFQPPSTDISLPHLENELGHHFQHFLGT